MLSVVILFQRRAFLVVEIDQAEDSDTIVHNENACKCDYTRVLFDNGSLGLIEMLQDWSLSKDRFKLPKYEFCLLGPFQFDFPKVF